MDDLQQIFDELVKFIEKFAENKKISKPKNKEELETMKTRIANMETQINTISSNVSELISALKSSMAKKEE